MVAIKNGNNLLRSGNSLLTVEGGGGITPTGNIEIQQQSGTDVTQYATASVKAGSLTNLKAVKGTVSNHSVVVTPQITVGAGWVSSAPSASTVTVNASDLVSGTLDITENGTKDVTNYASVNVNVSSGGGGNPIYVYHGYKEVAKTSLSSTGVEVTVSEAGNYKISWTAARSSSSGTMSTRLYINGSAKDSDKTTWTRTYGQFITISSYTLNANDKVQIYARSGSTSRYCMVGNLIVEKL